MAFIDDVRSQLIPSFISLAVVLAAGWMRYRRVAGDERAAAARGRVPAT